jgi:hypothetical protein
MFDPGGEEDYNMLGFMKFLQNFGFLCLATGFSPLKESAFTWRFCIAPVIPQPGVSIEGIAEILSCFGSKVNLML